MLFSLPYFLVLASALPTFNFWKKDEPKYFKSSFRIGPAPAPAALKKRYVSEPLDWKSEYYLVDFEVGSNNQKVTIIADTGSGNTWVVSPEASGNTGDTYDPSTSTTSQEASTLPVTYAYGTTDDRNTVVVYNYIDSWTIPGGPTVENVSFGVNSNNNDLGFGILGLGYDTIGVPFVQTLYDQGKISSNSISLYLESEGSSDGTILYGAIDHAKYYGELTHVGGVLVTIETDAGNSIPLNVQVLIDSGTPTFAFTNQTRDAVLGAIGAPSCDQGNKTFGFDLGPITIQIPYSEFVVPSSNGECEFVYIYEADPSESILGASFLKYTYSVFGFGSPGGTQLAPVKYTNDTNISGA